MIAYSICDPFRKDVVKKGKIEFSEVLSTFQEFPWLETLKKMEHTPEEDIYYSPSVEFYDNEQKRGLEISAVANGDHVANDGFIFYVFYKRPKTFITKKWFKQTEQHNPEYVSECLDLSLDETKDILKNFAMQRYDDLEKKFS